jgi:hypothetical protein
VPAEASRLNPPWPLEDIPLPVHVSEYVAPGVYWEGSPVNEGMIIASVWWHVQPLLLWPILPEEFASIDGIRVNNMATMRILAIRVKGDISLANHFSY